jgi:murein DD-endopeptidase MepM/ murein hydrolase activator NlpD
MALKKSTIFMVPWGTKKVKQIRVPRFLPGILLTLFLASAFFLAWMVQDYLNIKSQMPRLAQLQREKEQHRTQSVYLAKRIDRLSQKVSELCEFDSKLKAMVNLETEQEEKQFQGVGGSGTVLVASEAGVVKSHEELVRLMHRSLDNLENQVALGKQDKAELHEFLENQKILLASTPSIWPVKGWLSSRFGKRVSPFTGEKEFHRGIDVPTRMGAPVQAPADGIVSSMIWDHGYGNVLTLKHGYGLVTKYAHLKKVLVKRGQHVKRGETIALVGDSGRSTGPHLHYEVHLNRVAVNPLRYILN